MTKILLSGGEVIDIDGQRTADLIVDSESGQIVEVGTGLDTSGVDETIDVTGCIVAPGLVDLHAHIRQPGNEAAETVASAAAAAAAGGYTAIVAMPDTDPCADNAASISDLLSLAEGAACEIIPAGALSIGQHGKVLAPIAEMVELGVTMFTDNAPGVQDPRFMRRALEYLGSIEAPDGHALLVGQHAEVAALGDGGVMHEGTYSTKLGLPGKPTEAEEIQVMRDVALARLTGVPVHFQKLTTAGSFAMVRAAKAGGVPVTASVTPHHFTFTDADCVGFNPNFRVDPPLRTSGDIAALKTALTDGSVDAIVSDHSPYTIDVKELPFDSAGAGTIGLETALAVALTELDIPIAEVLSLMSWGPAKLARVFPRHGGPITKGAKANLCVIDPSEVWTVVPERGASRSSNSIFSQRQLTGRVRHTIFAGRLTTKNSKTLQATN